MFKMQMMLLQLYHHSYFETFLSNYNVIYSNYNTPFYVSVCVCANTVYAHAYACEILLVSLHCFVCIVIENKHSLIHSLTRLKCVTHSVQLFHSLISTVSLTLLNCFAHSLKLFHSLT